MTMQKIRVLIVEDSALMRKKITEMINSSVDCEVIAIARDGFEALHVIQTLKPDVITLDLQLPKMDGLTCLGYIMSEWPTPVLVLSAFTREGSLMAIQALEYGAIDFIAKPGGVISPNITDIKEELLNKIRLASKITVSKLKLLSLSKAKKLKQQGHHPLQKLILIGASTGGPSAIVQILNVLPSNLPMAILIIQHMPKNFISSFSQRLDQQCRLKVKEAEHGDVIQSGQVLMAPYGFDMLLDKKFTEEGMIANIILKKNNSSSASPLINPTFSSAATIFKENTIGILLTGMGKDGVKGCQTIKEMGGKVIVEDESTCIVNGMPAAAISAKVVDKVLPLHQIPQAILTEVRGYT